MTAADRIRFNNLLDEAKAAFNAGLTRRAEELLSEAEAIISALRLVGAGS